MLQRHKRQFAAHLHEMNFVRSSNPKDPGVQLDEVGEVHVQDSVPEDRADLVCLLQAYPHVEVETWEDERVRDATQINEMPLVFGLDAGAATRKIV